MRSLVRGQAKNPARTQAGEIASQRALYNPNPSEVTVRTYAGVSQGVTVGVLGSAGANTATLQDSGGLQPARPTTGASFAALTGLGTISGDGSFANPYTITNRDWYSPASAGPLIEISAPTQNYWVKFDNVHFSGLHASGTELIRLNLNVTTSSGCIFQGCTFRGNGATSTDSLVEIAAGTVIFTSCNIPEMLSYGIRKTGANATITMTDFRCDPSRGAWGQLKPIFSNAVAGGSLSLSRATFAHQAGNPLIGTSADWGVTLDKVLWNSDQNAAVREVIPTYNANVPTWSSGLTITDSRFYSGTGNVTMFGHNTTNDNAGVQNWNIRNIEVIMSTDVNALMFAIGNTSATFGESTGTKNISIQWSRFKRPQTAAAPGHEILYIGRAADVDVGYCWIDSCSEDGYEFHQPVRNNKVHHCGIGEVSAGELGAGNAVDFYGGGSVWDAAAGNTGGHEIKFIWGACQGDAIIVDSVHGVQVQDIDVDNVTGGARSLDQPPASNVRLHARGPEPLNNVIVSRPLTSPSISFNSKPVELTYESATVRTSCSNSAGSLSYEYWNGAVWTTYTSAGDPDGNGATGPAVTDAMAT